MYGCHDEAAPPPKNSRQRDGPRGEHRYLAQLHVSPKKIRAIYDLGAVEGLSINNLPKHGAKCNCEDCIIARASRSTVEKVREYRPLADKPFHIVSTDIK